MNRITGRSAFLALLKDEGITHLFGNPGTTELPIMHALKDHPDLTYVMAMQESLVVAIADGFSRASGRLVACNVHVAPGLGNAMGSLFNASFTGTPMILTAGQQEQGHGLTEPVLYGPLVQMAEPLVKWAVEVTRLEDLPRIVHRAAKIATTPPTGPVFISLPGDILNAEAGIELGRSTRVDTRVKPSDEALQALVQRILKAERPVIITGDEIVKSDALQEAALLAATLGCPAYQSSTPYGASFLSESPCFMGALSRLQKQVREVLSPYDLMIVLGADPLRMSVYSEVDPLPEGLRARGWNVDVVEAYRTAAAPLDDERRASLAAADMITFTSSSTVTRFLDAAGPESLPPVVATIGPVTAATAREHGVPVDIEAEAHSIDGLIDAILGWAATGWPKAGRSGPAGTNLRSP